MPVPGQGQPGWYARRRPSRAGSPSPRRRPPPRALRRSPGPRRRSGRPGREPVRAAAAGAAECTAARRPFRRADQVRGRPMSTPQPPMRPGAAPAWPAAPGAAPSAPPRPGRRTRPTPRRSRWCAAHPSGTRLVRVDEDQVRALGDVAGRVRRARGRHRRAGRPGGRRLRPRPGRAVAGLLRTVAGSVPHRARRADHRLRVRHGHDPRDNDHACPSRGRVLAGEGGVLPAGLRGDPGVRCRRPAARAVRCWRSTTPRTPPAGNG
ncbi:hypothetical protein SALBM217S_05802 [Streptomyces griseoloalbus]